jgi:DnaJ-class molecular chaperone
VSKKEFYKILEVDSDATQLEITKAYRQLVLRWHPDKNLTNKEEAENKFKEILKAYEVLSNPETRKQYDENKDNLINF